MFKCLENIIIISIILCHDVCSFSFGMGLFWLKYLISGKEVEVYEYHDFFIEIVKKKKANSIYKNNYC